MINKRHSDTLTGPQLCILLVLMIVEKRGVSKLSDYSGSVFSVFTPHGLVFHLGMREISLMCVSQRRPPWSLIVVSMVF